MDQNQPPQPERPATLISTPPAAPPPGSPPGPVKTFTPTSRASPGQPGWHKFIFPGLTALILAGGLGIGIALVSNQRRTQEVRAPAKVSPPRAKCGLEVSTSETASAGQYSVEATVIYTGNQNSVELTYFWAKCRCQQGGGNSTQGGRPICKAFWPTDPGECSIGSQQTAILEKGSSVRLSQSVNQHQNLDCGSYQLDLIVVDVSGEVCNQFIPAYGFYPTGKNCDLPTPAPTQPPATPAPSPTATPEPSKKACQETCASSDECDGSMVCLDGKCVNADCPEELDCVCPGETPTPEPPKVEKPEELPPSSGGLGILRALWRLFH